MNDDRGHTLVEMMVALTLASMVTVGALSLFVAQAGVIQAETHRDQAAQEAQHLYDVISRLLRQAERDSISITSTAAPNGSTLEVANDTITIDFLVPAGFRVWPNTSGNDNAIRVTWSNTDEAAPYAVRIGTASTLAGLAGAPLIPLTGGDGSNTPRPINLDFWPLLNVNALQPASSSPAVAGYRLAIAFRAGKADNGYVNPADADGALRHYRVYTAAGIVSPRN